jgi:hypothetical protein
VTPLRLLDRSKNVLHETRFHKVAAARIEYSAHIYIYVIGFCCNGKEVKMVSRSTLSNNFGLIEMDRIRKV